MNEKKQTRLFVIDLNYIINNQKKGKHLEILKTITNRLKQFLRF